MQFTLNGQTRTYSGDPNLPLLTYLREHENIISPKDGCAPQAACGCCVVELNGKPGGLLQRLWRLRYLLSRAGRSVCGETKVLVLGRKLHEVLPARRILLSNAVINAKPD